MATWSCHLEMIKGDCLIRKCKIGAVTPDPNEWMNGGEGYAGQTGFSSTGSSPEGADRWE